MREDDRDLEGFFEMEGEEENLIGMAKVDLLNTNIHRQLLDMAIKLAGDNWLWKFKSTDYKLKKITAVYRYFNKIIEEAKDG